MWTGRGASERAIVHWFDIIRLRLRSLLHRDRVDRELDTELQFCLDERTERNIASGMTPAAARAAARRAFGNPVRVAEACRDARRLNLVENVAQDVRFAFRSFGRVPGFTVVVVATLALGIGANTAIFSVVNAVVLRPSPYDDSDRLVRLVENRPASETRSGAPVRLTARGLSGLVRR